MPKSCCLQLLKQTQLGVLLWIEYRWVLDCWSNKQTLEDATLGSWILWWTNCNFSLSQEWKISRLTFEYDSEPFGKERDAAIKKLAMEAGVEVIVKISHTLYDLEKWGENTKKHTQTLWSAVPSWVHAEKQRKSKSSIDTFVTELWWMAVKITVFSALLFIIHLFYYDFLNATISDLPFDNNRLIFI